jgi:hypothetical protein|tara:strand:- start:1537 stop:1761 length:225 start_codon:yes stop_codon:yes gene_type:complete
MKTRKFTEEEEQVFIDRAKDFMQRKPEASRARVAVYAGVGIGVLERLGKRDGFKLPEPMTSKQSKPLKKNWGAF